MRLISIQLRNIKSHRETDLAFAPGINVLSGANGSGKSTIFEAIGYALFGVSAQDFVTKAERFLSIGAKKGEIGVVFEGADGETYRVTRTVGTAGKWLLAKQLGDGFEVEDHANLQETEARIAKLLGLSGNRSLADQFKLVIGPFQNDFLGPFVIRQPTKRQDAFDEILGIDAWRKTFDGTKSLNSAIAAKIETLQAEVAGKQDQVAVLPAKEVELRTLSVSLAAKRGELERERAAHDAIAAQVANWDAHKAKLDETQSGLQAIQERVRSGNDHVANQQLLVQQAVEASSVVEAARAGKEAYVATEQRLKGLREAESQKNRLEKELAALEKEQSGLAAALGIEQREIDALAGTITAEEQKLALEEQEHGSLQSGLKEEESAARAALEAASRKESRFRELPAQRIENTLPYLEVALDRIQSLDTQLEQKQKRVNAGAELKDLAAALATRREDLERVQHEKSLLAGRHQALVEGCQQIGEGDCPFFQEPCQNLHELGGTALFASRIAETEAELARLDAKACEVAALVQKAQEAALELAGIDQVARELEQGVRERAALEKEFQARLAEIEPADLLKTLRTFLASLEVPEPPVAPLQLALKDAPSERCQQLADWSGAWGETLRKVEAAVVAAVKTAEEPVQSCLLKLRELGVRGETLERRKRDLQGNREKLAQRQQAVAAQQQRLSELQVSTDHKRSSLEAFIGLDRQIEEAGAELTRYQADRDRFIAHEQAALELGKRQETLGKYQERLAALEKDLAAKSAEVRELQDSYQAEAHQLAKGERERLTAAVARLQAEIAAAQGETKRLEVEITVLTRIAAEIEEKLAAVEDLREQGNLVKFLRTQLFKNVSSQLSERFREEISFRADRIYRSIAESDEELFWGENYQIILKDMVDGALRERSDDQLSGGQMMSAVVALRLALLQTIGARIAFFDEPTSNLDAERRENLARAFRAIDVGKEEVTEHWYDQLFLVSHDVSFTEITDQMIHLEPPKN
ncbi:hypothetical protein GMLC_01950 [Geomonas limicola]|uniref:RecF/RecN/SMC N-terminal domain-containing protein n=1 Tax=Geomonas limicola TaxID=2740186 RepID=A0A6V8N2A6_9BACT|nr:SMC family ATPase [Geomonas limicola]GFO66616.1 hypothetical protein GMLC_01950 [Geomonas limicola]